MQHLVKSHGPIEDPSPVAYASRSLILGQADGLVSYKATSGLIASSNCCFSDWEIDSQLLALLKVGCSFSSCFCMVDYCLYQTICFERNALFIIFNDMRNKYNLHSICVFASFFYFFEDTCRTLADELIC